MPGYEPGTVGEGRELEAGRLVAFVPHVLHGAVIAFLETFAESVSVASINGWVLVDTVVVGIGTAVVGEVAASCFNTFVEATALGVLIGVGRTIPVVIAILR